MTEPLDEQRLFLRIVESGSLKRAAEEIDADPATVTRRLSALEARLGVKLLERARTGATSTEAGQRYYDEMRKLVPTFDAAEAEVAGLTDTPRGLVRLSSPVDFGSRYVVLWMNDLQCDHDALEIDLLLSDEYVDLAGQSVDIALRIGELSDSALIARRLGSMPLLIVGAPGYLSDRGRPQAPDQLSVHSFVLYSWMQFGRVATLECKNGSREKVSLNTRFSVNNVGAIRQAVLAGAGLHIGPEWIFAEDLESGRLERVLPDWAPPPAPVQVLYRHSPFVPAKLRAVIDKLATSCASVPGIVR